jgi:YesN/AraC family two-component response regulator
MSFSILVLFVLALFSGALYYSAESIVLDMQREANKKVLSQIKFNINYVNDVIQNLVTSLYYDNDVISLMNMNGDSDIFETLRKRARIDKLADYTPFIHSIVIYNAQTDQFYWGGDPILQTRDAPIYGELREMFKGGRPVPKLEMQPMSLTNQKGKVDVFSMFDYDSLVYQPGQSVLVINIKPEWLFDNIKLMNKLAWQENENVFIMEKNGTMLTPDLQTFSVSDDMKRTILEHVAQSSGEETGYFTYSIGGKKKIVNFLGTGMNGWILISVQPYETLIKKVNTLKNTSIVLTLFFIILSLLAILGVSHRLYRPVGKLVNAIRGDESLESDPNPASDDELKFMSDVYQQTIRHLRSARNEQITTRHIVRSYYIRKIVADSSAVSADQVEEWIGQHHLAFSPSGPYLLCVMKLDDSAGSRHTRDDKERQLLHFAIANIAQEILLQSFLCEVVEMKSEHLVAVISMNEASAAAEGDVRGQIETIQDVIAKMYRVTFSAALSDTVPHYRSLFDQYLFCLQALRYTLVFGNQSLIRPGMVRNNMSSKETVLPSELEKKLAESIKSNQNELFQKTLDKIFDHIATLNCDYMIYMALHIFILMQNAIKDMNDYRIVPLSVGLSDINRKMMDSSSLDNMKSILLEVYQEINENKKSPEQERNEVLVDTIKDIVEQNYADIGLSLQKIGDSLKLSPEYIGKLFKKQQGLSVSEFINEVRLRHTVVCLEQGDYTINELIEKNGFGTRSNFFRLFKNKYGTTPKEYRTKRSILLEK